jgi:hypothetical protein
MSRPRSSFPRSSSPHRAAIIPPQRTPARRSRARAHPSFRRSCPQPGRGQAAPATEQAPLRHVHDPNPVAGRPLPPPSKPLSGTFMTPTRSRAGRSRSRNRRVRRDHPPTRSTTSPLPPGSSPLHGPDRPQPRSLVAPRARVTGTRSSPQPVYSALHPLTTSSPARTSSQVRSPHRAGEPLKKSQVEREGTVKGAVFSSTARFSSTPRARSATQCAQRRPHYPPSSLVLALLVSWRFSLLSSCPRDRCAYCPDTSSIDSSPPAPFLSRNSFPPAPFLARQGGGSVKWGSRLWTHVPSALPGEAGGQGVESPTDRAPRPLALHAGSPPFPTPPSPSPVSE